MFDISWHAAHTCGLKAPKKLKTIDFPLFCCFCLFVDKFDQNLLGASNLIKSEGRGSREGRGRVEGGSREGRGRSREGRGRVEGGRGSDFFQTYHFPLFVLKNKN